MATTYYIDLDNGDDTLNNGTSAVKTNGDGPWLTINKFTANVRVAGDKAIVRRGTTETASADVTFTSDGTLAAPIILEADFDNAWSDDVSSDQTYTPVWGSKTMEANDTITTLAAGEWIYNATDGDDPRLFAYEVASVSGTTLTLKLPFKGTAGSTKTLTVMLAAPIWNDAVGNYQINLDNDHYWKFQGMHFKGSDTAGIFEIDSSDFPEIKDCIFTANSGTVEGIFFSDNDCGICKIEKSRFYECDSGAIAGNGSTGSTHIAYIRNCYIDTCDSGLYLATGSRFYVSDTEFDSCITGILTVGGIHDIICRNVIFTSCTYNTDTLVSNGVARNNVYIDDYDGTVGLSKFSNYLNYQDSTPVITSDTTTVRSGGGDSSIKVAPGYIINTDQDLNTLKVFEYPIQATTDSKTYTVYFKTNATANWTNDPTAAQLYLEAEYYFSAAVADKAKKVSTGVVDFNGSTDWQSITLTVAPAQAGVLVLRCWYGKTKEGASNEFFVDTKIVIS